MTEYIINYLKRNWYGIYTGIVVSVIPTGQLFMNTYFADKYKTILSMHEYTKPVSIHPRINLLFNQVLQELKIKEKERKYYEPFMFVGLDTYSIGAPYFKTGAKIGIPLTYAYSKVEEVNAPKIYISTDVIDWSKPQAQLFLKTLIMPEEARKFAIAREIVLSQSLDFFREIFICPIFIILANSSYLQLYDVLKFAKRIAIIRVFTYCCCALTSGVLWLLQDNWFKYRKEKNVDRILASKGPAFIKGGFQFYDMILERNMALRPLLKEDEAKQLTDRGEQVSIRYAFKKLFIADRRNFFATKLKECMKENPDAVLTL